MYDCHGIVVYVIHVFIIFSGRVFECVGTEVEVLANADGGHTPHGELCLLPPPPHVYTLPELTLLSLLLHSLTRPVAVYHSRFTSLRYTVL